ncbi:hypothetical protein [Plantactinospora sp. KLBMP9567]|nr:hypothetical protein [Plantactinospora sp. KLBMP9567]MDW5330503.1 hypothetical protein [Plantactinospora sp. KLBMP9567]
MPDLVAEDHASRLLRESDAPLAAIAARGGNASEFASGAAAEMSG